MPASISHAVTEVYAELRRIAHRYMNREGRGHTLQTTELVNEAYLRLIDASQVRWQDRPHFFNSAGCSVSEGHLILCRDEAGINAPTTAD